MSIWGLFGVPDMSKLEAKRDVSQLIKALNYQKDSIIRCQAAQALGRIGDTRAVDSLINRLKDEDSIVRECTVEALGLIGDARAIKPLADALNDDETLVREYAVEALGNIGNELAIKPLIRALKDEDFLVADAAIEALGKIGGARAVKILIEIIKDQDQPSTMITSAAKALGKIGNPQAIEPLVNVLKTCIPISKDYVLDECLIIVEVLEQFGAVLADKAISDFRSRMSSRLIERKVLEEKKLKKKICPKCSTHLEMENASEYVEGIYCPSCGWATILCYECQEGWMKAIPQRMPDLPLQAWLNCDSCGKRSRADHDIISWLKRKKYPGFFD